MSKKEQNAQIHTDDCPKGQKQGGDGKCKTIKKEYTEDPTSRNIIPNPNLRIPDSGPTKAYIVKKETSNLPNDNNIHVLDQPDTADKLMAKVRNVNARAPQSVSDRNVIDMRTTKFKKQKFGVDQF